MMMSKVVVVQEETPTTDPRAVLVARLRSFGGRQADLCLLAEWDAVLATGKEILLAEPDLLLAVSVNDEMVRSAVRRTLSYRPVPRYSDEDKARMRRGSPSERWELDRAEQAANVTVFDAPDWMRAELQRLAEDADR